MFVAVCMIVEKIVLLELLTSLRMLLAVCSILL